MVVLFIATNQREFVPGQGESEVCRNARIIEVATTLPPDGYLVEGLD